jgi:cell fate regulator YaaT (PSP1 superfamily)
MVQSTINLETLVAEPPKERSHAGCGACGSGKSGERCGNGLEKIYPTTAVRFGYLRYIGEFSHSPDMKFTCGAKVVVQTHRGVEMGEQVSLTCSGCDKSVTRDQMRAWVETCGQDSFLFDAGRILREATAADLADYVKIQSDNRARRDFCRSLAQARSLPIRIVDCEALFGGERILFYFTSEQRVDFRELVKTLAHEYRTRIELRQIGARDEARLLADYETCGREVCCKVFLKTLKPITMRMAKLQKATLDPSQVSGRCGRLKCCLRYEHESYESLDKRLPKLGARIRTNHGEGVVVNRQVLTQLVQIRTDDEKLVTVVAEDVIGPAAAPAAPVAGSRQNGQPLPMTSKSPARSEDTARAPVRPPSPRPQPGQAPKGRDSAAPRREPRAAPRPQESSGGTGRNQPPNRHRRRRPFRRSIDDGPGPDGFVGPNTEYG